MDKTIIFIGGGINNLVAASLLAKKGKKVLLLERTEHLGGCIRSETIEDCTIDTFSTAYPLFVTGPAYALLKDDLEAQGIAFVGNDTPTATVLSDQRFAILKTARPDNQAAFNAFASGDGDRFREQISWVEQNADLLFSILGQEPVTLQMAKLLGKTLWKKGVKPSLELVGECMASIRNEFPNHVQSDEVNALLTPWILHTGLSPESPFSAAMAKIIAFTVELVGLPLIQGGSYKIVEAFKAIIEKHGGSYQLNTHVEEILIDANSKKAYGVKTADGNIHKGQYIVASTTPTLLYNQLIKDKSLLPQVVKKQADEFKYGMGNMQIHLVLNEAPKWFNQELSTVCYTHLSDGMDTVSRSVNQAIRQQLPTEATICIAQPSAIDPSRAADGKHILWIQLPECPNYPSSDAAGELNDLCQGEWTEQLKNAYANRILKRISKYIANVETACIAKKVISPKELSQANINLMHGDPYGGSCVIEQYLLWRPLKATKNHETPIKNLYHSGASTHPGPGLSGGSGFLIYQKLLKK